MVEEAKTTDTEGDSEAEAKKSGFALKPKVVLAATLKRVKDAKGSRNMKRTAIQLTAVVVALLAVVVGVFGVLIYVYKSDNPAVKAVASVVPYPVQTVNGRFVTYNDYLFEVDANKRAYQNNAKLNNQPA